jgi:hypothetical protein
VAQPWKRDFRRPDLDRWAQQNRGKLLGAVLTIGRAWFARGQPNGSAAPWGSYHGWAETLAGMLFTAGVPGFLGNLDDLYEGADVETAGWRNLLSYLRAQIGDSPVRVANLASLIIGAGDKLEPPPAVTAALGHSFDSAVRNVRLAAKFAAIEGRRFDDTGLRIERAGRDGHTKSVLWRVAVDAAIVDPSGEGVVRS